MLEYQKFFGVYKKFKFDEFYKQINITTARDLCIKTYLPIKSTVLIIFNRLKACECYRKAKSSLVFLYNPSQ